ncbi:hypothetical protein COEREDRAFT_90155 [Coemansia reversa NRRL 1564]|uniref:Uncharacterized protein n=1 Tax=Coemansia reversa (strain ATCC 12441 / NRRL 1564) TaxID=763665 RepID=A0A2G5B0P3_COERN|nr:hypothetical protein COEREDRAFT_90155 [Coemansia reversa NRRL 1564]|eukprot:PIA12596.1 hypothetical protein COEREDRAFT_90155 [Coemansia reversa NRRL 1564]
MCRYININTARLCRYKPKQEWCGYHDPLRWHHNQGRSPAGDTIPHLPPTYHSPWENGRSDYHDLIKEQQHEMKEEFNSIKASIEQQQSTHELTANFEKMYFEQTWRDISRLKESLTHISRFLGIGNTPCIKHGLNTSPSCARCVEYENSFSEGFCKAKSPSCFPKENEGENGSFSDRKRGSSDEHEDLSEINLQNCFANLIKISEGNLQKSILDTIEAAISAKQKSLIDLLVAKQEDLIKPIYNVVLLMLSKDNVSFSDADFSIGERVKNELQEKFDKSHVVVSSTTSQKNDNDNPRFLTENDTLSLRNRDNKTKGEDTPNASRQENPDINRRPSRVVGLSPILRSKMTLHPIKDRMVAPQQPYDEDVNVKHLACRERSDRNAITTLTDVDLSSINLRTSCPQDEPGSSVNVRRRSISQPAIPLTQTITAHGQKPQRQRSKTTDSKQKNKTILLSNIRPPVG